MKLQLKFTADTCELAGMRHDAREFLITAGVPEMDAELMVLALDEACTNIIRYAYGGITQRSIRLHLVRSDTNPQPGPYRLSSGRPGRAHPAFRIRPCALRAQAARHAAYAGED